MHGWGGDQVIVIDPDAWLAVGTNDYTTTNNPTDKLTVEGSISSSGKAMFGGANSGSVDGVTVQGDISASG